MKIEEKGVDEKLEGIEFAYGSLKPATELIPNRKGFVVKFERDYASISEQFFKGIPLKIIAEITDIAYPRVCKILRAKGVDYDHNVGLVFTTKKGSTLTLTSVAVAGNVHNDTLYNLTCSCCSKDKKLFPKGTIRSTKDRLSSGKVPCGCRDSVMYNKEQREDLVSRKLLSVEKDKSISVASIHNNDMVVSCSVCQAYDLHIDVNRFLRTGVINCGCNTHYKYKSLEERVETFNAELALNNMTNYKALCYIEDTGKFIGTCTTCSKDTQLWPYGSIVLPKYLPVRKSYVCSCGDHVVWTQEQYYILIVRRCEEDGFTFNGFVGDYLGGSTCISITCEDGHSRDTTMIESFINKKKNRCVDCKVKWAGELYASDPVEMEQKLISSMLPQHDFLGFEGEVFRNQNQKFFYYCSEKDEIFKRTIRSFLDGSKGSCCKGGGFKVELEGYFYLVYWCKEGHSSFYKYGITNSNPLSRIKSQKGHTEYTPNYIGGFKFLYGGDAALLEKVVNGIFKDQAVGRDKLPDGFTETVDEGLNEFAGIDLQVDIENLTGYNIFTGLSVTDAVPLMFKDEYKYVSIIKEE